MKLLITKAKGRYSRFKFIITLTLTVALVLSGFPAERYIHASINDSQVPGPITKEYSPGAQRLVVEITPGTDPQMIASMGGGELVRTGPFNYCTLEFYPEDESHKIDILNNVLNVPGVKGAQWSKKYKIDTEESADYANQEDSLTNSISRTAYTSVITDPEYILQWGVQKVRADKVWQEGVTGKDIIIAVVDTGVDLTHPDLVDKALGKNNIVQGYNAFTGKSEPNSAQDDHGHGTSVAGVIAALNNNKGIVGIAYDAKIMPIKVMDKDGEGEDSIIADGIRWAVDHGAKIINMSIGSEEQAKVLDEALLYAADKGVILVGASGNKKGYLDVQSTASLDTASSGVAFPGANPNVIAVSALDKSDTVSDFALTGPEVLLSAPGRRILTDYWEDGETGAAYSTGTSIAAPFVSGAAALLWSKYPQLSSAEIQQALMKSAYDLGNKGRDDQYGYGRLDVYRALKSLEEAKSYPSPTSLGWEGGRVLLPGSTEEPDAVLTIPSGAFSLQVDQNDNDKRISISFNKTTPPGEFPEGIIPAGDAITINPWGEAPVEKVLTLTVKLNPQQIDPAQMNTQIAYLYKWSTTRWIRVGGGMSASSPTMPVTLYEPGIYRAGWSPEPDTDRIAGTDRILTAIEISHYAFPTGADNVIIARADDFPDALAGAPLAYKYQAPILLTYPNNLPAEVLQAVQDLAPKQIFILGGTGAVSEEVKKQLESVALVTRISGANRYETAAAVADKLGTKGEAVVVNGTTFPDAIAAASHAGILGRPILLTSKDSLTNSTQENLRKYSVTTTEVIGGVGVVSEQVLKKLPLPRRISGNNRYTTSAEVINTYKPSGKIFFVSTGLTFPDALTGGILASGNAANIMLIHPTGPTPEQKAIIDSIKDKKIIALGGEGAVPQDLLQNLKI